MKKVSIDTWIQLLGMLSVVAGLVFVGLEMQQTQRIALANQQQARTELITDMMLVDMELVGDFGASGQIATDWEGMNPQQIMTCEYIHKTHQVGLNIISYIY